MEGWGAVGVITVALTLRSSTNRTPSDFSPLLMFVINCIMLEDSDGGGRWMLYGTNIDNSWLLGIREEKMQTMLMNGN